jgi:hypothetical protein
VTIVQRHQRYMRSGYSIPMTMWWMFWPMGTKEKIELETGEIDEWGTRKTVTVLNPVVERARVERQVNFVNHAEWMALMVKLGVVKEG